MGFEAQIHHSHSLEGWNWKMLLLSLPAIYEAHSIYNLLGLVVSNSLGEGRGPRVAVSP